MQGQMEGQLRLPHHRAENARRWLQLAGAVNIAFWAEYNITINAC